MIALATPERFSIVTIFGAAGSAPAWETMFGWPGTSHDSVPFDVDSPAARKLWAARLDRVVQDTDRAVLLVADGLGCAASAWWARLSPADYVAKVAGAVLFAPSTGPTAPLFESPRVKLPFPALVIQPDAGVQDPRIAEWGARLVVGHRDRRRVPSSVGWKRAQSLFLRLTSGVVEQDVGRVQALTRSRPLGR